MRDINSMRTLTSISALIALAVVAATANADPQYQIYDIGVIQVGDSASQGFGASTGGIAVGRSVRTGGAQAFSWTLAGGIVGLPNLAGRSYAVSNSANDTGTVVGTGATTSFGSSRLPVIWQTAWFRSFPFPPARRSVTQRRERFGRRRRVGRRRKSTRSDL